MQTDPVLGGLQAPSPATSKRIFRRLMPLLILCYIMSFLDRTNIGMAKERLEIDLGIDAAAYGLGAGLFFLTYALSEIPSNLILHKVGARLWITRIMITWGLISAAMALVQGPISFYVLRMLLGFAEAGLYPGVLFFLTLWFPHAERARANGMFLMGACFASIIGAPLGGALLQLEGLAGLAGWQWMFVIEGLPACLLAFVVLKVLPNRPSEAKWLDKEEALRLETYIEAENAAGAAEAGNHNFRAVFRDRQILLVIAIYFTNQIAVYSLSYFLPSIIGEYGQLTPLQIGMLTSLPWVAAAIGLWLVPRWAKKGNSARRWIIQATAGIVIGLSIGATSGPVVGLLGFCIVGFWFLAPQPLLFAHAGSRLQGATLAAGLALVNTCGLLGGFVGPFAMGAIEKSTGNPASGMLFVAALSIVAIGLGLLLKQPKVPTNITASEANISTR